MNFLKEIFKRKNLCFLLGHEKDNSNRHDNKNDAFNMIDYKWCKHCDRNYGKDV